jgi:hypothetical protein
MVMDEKDTDAQYAEKLNDKDKRTENKNTFKRKTKEEQEEITKVVQMDSDKENDSSDHSDDD